MITVDFFYLSNITKALIQRKYELKNHLGNVMTTINGIKIPVPSSSNPNTIEHFSASIDATFDYTAFGVNIHERQYNTEGYRYGFQED